MTKKKEHLFSEWSKPVHFSASIDTKQIKKYYDVFRNGGSLTTPLLIRLNCPRILPS